MRNAVIGFIEARCFVGKQVTRRKWFVVVTLNICCFHILKIFMKAREEMGQKLWTSAALQWCHGILNRLRTRRANIHYGKDFTANVACHAWKRKFVCNSVGCFTLVD